MEEDVKFNDKQYELDSDEDMEAAEERILRTAKQLNRQRNARSKSKAKKRKEKN